MFKFIVFCSFVVSCFATTGFDAVQPEWKTFFIARVWESIGNFDETGIANIKNAKAGGFIAVLCTLIEKYEHQIVCYPTAGWEYVDGYIFPCLKSSCATPEAQVEATINRLHAEGANFGMIWLDLEVFAWPADQNYNRNFIIRMGNQLNAMKINWGVYTNNNNWAQIIGIDWNGVSSRPLWWANYNGHQDYSSFVTFGRWSKPAIHQYSGDYRGPCGVDLDQN